jgi:hypothetical protein
MIRHVLSAFRSVYFSSALPQKWITIPRPIQQSVFFISEYFVINNFKVVKYQMGHAAGGAFG